MTKLKQYWIFVALLILGVAAITSGQMVQPGRQLNGPNARQTVTVDSATTFAVSGGYILLQCTGAETINTITNGSVGYVVYIENSDSECTIADDDDATAANAIDLTGAAANDVGAVAKVIVLIFNGTYWLQVTESDN